MERMNPLDLDPRTQEILRQTVRTFIAFGDPVGSRTLAKLNAQGLSPATIRNIMADLEELGYLYQPHTSAGRVPTDKGYRFYVSTVMSGSGLSPAEQGMIAGSLKRSRGDVTNLLQETSHLLASMTDMVSFVTSPDIQQSPLKEIDFMKLAPRRVLVVLVSETGQVVHRVIDLAEDFTGNELERCARYLNAQFRGFTLSEARETLLLKLREERDLYDQVVKTALTLGRAAFAESPSSSDLYLEGTSRMLNKPEFSSNIQRVQQLFTTLEEKNRFLEILNACLEGHGVQIVIGSEARVPDLEGMSLIAASYRFLDRELGSVGIMGPTRMEYAKFISVVDYIASSLSDTISQGASRPRHV
jgi:heat-inducible transcriptional repressor